MHKTEHKTLISAMQTLFIFDIFRFTVETGTNGVNINENDLITQISHSRSSLACNDLIPHISRSSLDCPELLAQISRSSCNSVQSLSEGCEDTFQLDGINVPSPIDSIGIGNEYIY